MELRAAKVATLKRAQLSMATSTKKESNQKLREWQEFAKSECLKHFALGKKVWVQEAVTGAGKTKFAVETAFNYFKSDEVNLIIVLTPSLATLNGWMDSFGALLNTTDGDPSFPADTQVWVSTYAGYKKILGALAECNRRINGFLLIADEYHHAEREACWGQAVTTLGRSAKNVLMLSGTPWKTKGTIALVDEEKNIEGQPYYGKDGKIIPDNCYKYAKDLGQDSANRATVPVHFTFVPSISSDENTGRTYTLPVKGWAEWNPKEWRKYADEKCNEPLGRHVTIGSADYRLKDSDVCRKLLAEGFDWLSYSRGQIKQTTGISDLSIMLVVCRNISEAKTVAVYIQEEYKVSTEVIVSDDPGSAERLERIRMACKQGSHSRPDVIVSVGMISEGVDIPAIKVIVYMGAIITILYLMQLIGRAMRRILVNGRYSDESLNQTLAYVVAPAHPFIMWFASQVENDIAQALKEIGVSENVSPETNKKEKLVPCYKTTVMGESAHVCRNNFVEKVQLFGAIDKMLNYDCASDFNVTPGWKDYLVGLIIDGKSDAVEMMIRQKCLEMNLEYEDLIKTEEPGRSSNYKRDTKLASAAANQLVKDIRRDCLPYSQMETDVVFRKIWNMLCDKASIRRFTDATLEEKERFVNIAENYYRANARV